MPCRPLPTGNFEGFLEAFSGEDNAKKKRSSRRNFCRSSAEEMGTIRSLPQLIFPDRAGRQTLTWPPVSVYTHILLRRVPVIGPTTSAPILTVTGLQAAPSGFSSVGSIVFTDLFRLTHAASAHLPLLAWPPEFRCKHQPFSIRRCVPSVSSGFTQEFIRSTIASFI